MHKRTRWCMLNVAHEEQCLTTERLNFPGPRSIPSPNTCSLFMDRRTGTYNGFAKSCRGRSEKLEKQEMWGRTHIMYTLETRTRTTVATLCVAQKLKSATRFDQHQRVNSTKRRTTCPNGRHTQSIQGHKQTNACAHTHIPRS